jgi:peptidyl-prolyl cis-trans isomerase C
MKRILHCLIILSACCYGASFAATTDDQPENPVLARVNGVDITMQEVKHFIERQQKQVNPQQALMEMVNVELLTQAAKNEGMMEDETLALEIKHNTSGLIASHYLNNYLNKLEITDEELHKRYKKEYESGAQGLEYNANHILLATEEEAIDLIKQLDKGGDFEALAKEKSTGPSGKNGGALGWFKSGDMVAPFFDAASKLKPGSHSDTPVQTQFGWHVIKLNETRKIKAPEFETVKDQLSNTIAAESIRSMLKALLEKSSVEFNPK